MNTETHNEKITEEQFNELMLFRKKPTYDEVKDMTFDEAEKYLNGYFYNCMKVTLTPPNGLIKCNMRDGEKPNIWLDACMAEEITDLWSKGIRTTGCCCGHGRELGFITVVVEDIEKMYELGYQNYIYPNFEYKDRKDTFIPKTARHIHFGYTNFLWG